MFRLSECLEFVFLLRLHTVMRIASISKSLSVVGLLQLYQQHKVDLDAPVQDYVPAFPRKQYEGEDVEITVRMLLSHMAGIRHYQKKLSKGWSTVTTVRTGGISHT